jgi:hypothetical protein
MHALSARAFLAVGMPSQRGSLGVNWQYRLPRSYDVQGGGAHVIDSVFLWLEPAKNHVKCTYISGKDARDQNG